MKKEPTARAFGYTLLVMLAILIFLIKFVVTEIHYRNCPACIINDQQVKTQKLPQ
jgi:hypothetical protein